MAYRTWVNAHFRTKDVVVEVNIQDAKFNHRLVYRKVKGQVKAVIARRRFRIGSSIGGTNWDGSPVGLAMHEFESANLVLLRTMTAAWLSGDTVRWAEYRTELENKLAQHAEGIEA